MAHRRDVSRSFMRFIAPLLALTLIIAFTIHDIQLKHEHVHREAHGHEETAGITEYMHAMDRKLLLVAIFFLAFSLWFSDRLRQCIDAFKATFIYGSASRSRPLCGYPRRFSWLSLFYSDGTIHRQYYG